MIGPFPAADGNGAVGTMIVCEGTDLAEIRAWAATDPYNAAGLFSEVHIQEMKKSLDKVFV